MAEVDGSGVQSRQPRVDSYLHVIQTDSGLNITQRAVSTVTYTCISITPCKNTVRPSVAPNLLTLSYIIIQYTSKIQMESFISITITIGSICQSYLSLRDTFALLTLVKIPTPYCLSHMISFLFIADKTLVRCECYYYSNRVPKRAWRR